MQWTGIRIGNEGDEDEVLGSRFALDSNRSSPCSIEWAVDKKPSLHPSSLPRLPPPFETYHDRMRSTSLKPLSSVHPNLTAWLSSAPAEVHTPDASLRSTSLYIFRISLLAFYTCQSTRRTFLQYISLRLCASRFLCHVERFDRHNHELCKRSCCIWNHILCLRREMCLWELVPHNPEKKARAISCRIC